jgi:hypothetical protein
MAMVVVFDAAPLTLTTTGIALPLGTPLGMIALRTTRPDMFIGTSVTGAW